MSKPALPSQSPPTQQGGIALITALIIVSIVVSVTAWLVERQQIDIRQTANVLHLEQAYQYAGAIEAWASAVLVRDYQDNKNIDSLDEDWAQELPSIPIEGGSLKAKLVDLQARFNLNNLLDKNDKPIPIQNDILKGLLERLSIDSKLAAVIIDWLDKNPVITGTDGAEMDYYLSLDQPYLAADTAMVNASELRLLKGMTPEYYSMLSQQIATLPSAGVPIKINLNTASSEVLASLGLSDTAATELIEDRKDNAFKSVSDVLSKPEFKQLTQDKPKLNTALSVKTQWFLLKAEVQIDRSRVRLNSVLFRDEKGVMHVVQRNYGI
jgi:general secretion pathway protein K